LNKDTNKPDKNTLWDFPWRFRESFIIATGLVVAGFLFESVVKPETVIQTEWPYNLIAGIVFIGLLFLVHISFRNHPFVQWFSSIPACISAISVFGIMALLLGLLPQETAQPVLIFKYLDLSDLNRSYPFLFTQIYFITTLGFVILRKALPVKGRNIGFLLNHTGLWLIIVTAMLGSGDLKRLIVYLYENNGFIQYATDNQLRHHKLPFSIKLIDFNIDEYNPGLVIFDCKTNEYLSGNRKHFKEIRKNLEVSMLGWDIIVKDYIQSSVVSGNKYESSELTGSSPAALIHATCKIADDSVSGWITCGSYNMAPQVLKLDERYLLVMTIPEPRKYNSTIELYSDKGIHDTVNLMVNMPVKVKGWKLYQSGYNSQMGKWSDLSIVELVRDPWLPVVYTGIFILMAGALYMFWLGKEIKE
jgi:hypothetical protein